MTGITGDHGRPAGMAQQLRPGDPRKVGPYRLLGRLGGDRGHARRRRPARRPGRAGIEWRVDPDGTIFVRPAVVAQVAALPRDSAACMVQRTCSASSLP